MDSTEYAAWIVSSPRWRERRPTLFFSAIWFTVITGSFLLLKTAPAPFLWVSLAWAVALWLSMLAFTGNWPRAILLNLGVLATLFAFAEVFFHIREFPHQEISAGFSVPDDILGWAPTKGLQAHAVERANGPFQKPGRLIYDVKYTIDSDGLRIAPPWRKEDSGGSVLFFGCSYTFGYGLGDNDTLPAQVTTQSAGRYRTYNFGFNGYSPAQMLAAIEHGTVHQVVDGAPTYAYYVAIPDHVWRVAGHKAWIKHQPRYVLDADGTVHAAGFFPDTTPLAIRLGLGEKVAGQLHKSAIWRTLELSESPISQDDIRLYLAIVRRSRDLLVAQYPDIKFRIILWPGRTSAQRSTSVILLDGFRQMGMDVDLAQDILPGYLANEAPFILSPLDPHPNATTNRLLAQYVVNELKDR